MVVVVVPPPPERIYPPDCIPLKSKQNSKGLSLLKALGGSQGGVGGGQWELDELSPARRPAPGDDGRGLTPLPPLCAIPIAVC